MSALKKALAAHSEKIDKMDEELADLERERQAYMKNRLEEIQTGKLTLWQDYKNSEVAVEVLSKQKELIN